MPTYIGENKIVDQYLGDKFLEAAYVGDKKVYDPYTEITGYLPMIYKSRAAVALKNYHIHGTSAGAGVETENMLNPENVEKGRIDNGVVGYQSGTSALTWDNSTNRINYTTTGNYRGFVTEVFDVVPNSYYTSNYTPSDDTTLRIAFYNSSDEWLNEDIIVYSGQSRPFAITIPNDASKMRMAFVAAKSGNHYIETPMLTKGSTATTSYIPHGYKLPLKLAPADGKIDTYSGVWGVDGDGYPYVHHDSWVDAYRLYTPMETINKGQTVTIKDPAIAGKMVQIWFFTLDSEGKRVNHTPDAVALPYTFTSTDNTKFFMSVKYQDESAITPFELSYALQTDVPIYIGDSQLMADEYVDYGEQKVYKRTENIVNSADSESGYINANNGLVQPSSVTKTTDYIEIDASEDYSALLTRVSTTQSTSSRSIAYYTESKTFISAYYGPSMSGNQVTFTLQNTPNNAKYVRFSYDVSFEQITFISSSTPPSSHIPYLQPTDPPIPLPPIPTYKGENTLSSTETLGEVTVKGRISEMPTT